MSSCSKYKRRSSMIDAENNCWNKTRKKAKRKILELREGILIRNATKDDLEKILEIEKASFKHIDAFPPTLFKKYLRELEEGFFVVLEKPNSIVGYAILGEEDGKGYLLSIAIHPKKRNQGFATSLLKFLEFKCYEKGLTKMTLEVRVNNKKAIAIYKNLGFTEVGKKKGFYEDGVDAWVMEKRLPIWMGLPPQSSII
ncbi:MAG: ribosomal protein S18-alanine N-acetyltransferase [Candidatus Bathyarchaeia archaeon]|nr:ribosomal protein S18-alanine N-acetyltransferase [Candidatus Bathyarchaeia archaeon]